MAKTPQNKAQQLLLAYRPTLWRKSALETVSRVASDATETNCAALQTCVAQIDFTQAMVQTLQDNRRLGNKMYRIIFVTYMTERQPMDIGEMLAEIAKGQAYIPRRTYFRLKKCALEMMDAYLEKMA